MSVQHSDYESQNLNQHLVSDLLKTYAVPTSLIARAANTSAPTVNKVLDPQKSTSVGRIYTKLVREKTEAFLAVFDDIEFKPETLWAAHEAAFKAKLDATNRKAA